jgi:hypothetical protein
MIVANNQMILGAASRLKDNGEITIEQYAQICRRYKELENASIIPVGVAYEDPQDFFEKELLIEYCGG